MLHWRAVAGAAVAVAAPDGVAEAAADVIRCRGPQTWLPMKRSVSALGVASAAVGAPRCGRTKAEPARARAHSHAVTGADLWRGGAACGRKRGRDRE
eukprot:scaffold3886_cov399-Prasinococcus_capsulatus_cf.AAC.16